MTRMLWLVFALTVTCIVLLFARQNAKEPHSAVRFADYYTPSIPMEKLQDKRVSEDTDDWFEKSTEELRERIKNGDDQALTEYNQRKEEFRKKKAVITNASFTSPSVEVSADNITIDTSQATTKGWKLQTPKDPIYKFMSPDDKEWITLNLSDVATLSSHVGKWKVKMPATRELVTQIPVKKGQSVWIISRTGFIKLHKLNDWVSTPQGDLALGKVDKSYSTSRFILQDGTYAGALLMRIDPWSNYLDIGGRKGDEFTIDGGDGKLIFGINTNQGENIYASGEYEFEFEIK